MTEEQQFWFILNHITGLGTKKVWEIYDIFKRSGITCAEFLNLKNEDYSKLFRLQSHFINLIESAFQQRKNTLQIYKHIDELKIKTVFIEDDDYPPALKTFVKGPPLFIYTIGNYDLLSKHIFGIFNSKSLSPEGLEIAFRTAEKFPDNDNALIYGNSLEAFEVIAYTSKKAGVPSIVVINRGLLELFKDNKISEFRTFCKNIGRRIDFENTLILSFVNPGFGWSIPIEQKRNEILFALSQRSLIIETKKNGIIFKNAIKAIQNKKEVFVYLPFSKLSGTATGNLELAEKGALPIAFDNEFINTKLFFSPDRISAHKKVTVSPLYEFIIRVLKLLTGKENNMVTDPACEDGELLFSAVQNGVSKQSSTLGFESQSGYCSEWLKKGLLDYTRLSNVSGLINDKKLGLQPDRFDMAFSSLQNREKEFKDSTNINAEIIHALLTGYELWKIKNNIQYNIPLKNNYYHFNLFINLAEKTTTKERLTYIYEQMQTFFDRNRKNYKDNYPEGIIKELISINPEVFYFERLLQLTKEDGIGAAICSPELFTFLTSNEVQKFISKKVFIFTVVNIVMMQNSRIIFFAGLKNTKVKNAGFSIRPLFYEIAHQDDYENILRFFQTKLK